MIKQRLLLLALWCLCQMASLVASLWMVVAILIGSRRAWVLAIAHDQLANVVFGGSEDETISSRAAKAARKGKRWGCILCRFLERIEPDHCENAIEADEGKTAS